MTHAYSIDTWSQQLILDLMKLVADSVATDDDKNDEYSSQDVNAASQHQNSPNDVTVIFYVLFLIFLVFLSLPFLFLIFLVFLYVLLIIFYFI